MKDSQHEDFHEEMESWKTEMLKDIEIITAGLKIQGEEGKVSLLKFYRGLSYKILKWKQFVRETNVENLNK